LNGQRVNVWEEEGWGEKRGEICGSTQEKEKWLGKREWLALPIALLFNKVGFRGCRYAMLQYHVLFIWRRGSLAEHAEYGGVGGCMRNRGGW
jgi:hypothetical protein